MSLSNKYNTYIMLGGFNFERKISCACRGEVTAVMVAVIALPRITTAVRMSRDGLDEANLLCSTLSWTCMIITSSTTTVMEAVMTMPWTDTAVIERTMPRGHHALGSWP